MRPCERRGYGYAKIATDSPDEQAREKASAAAVRPPKRFHYRYIAADYAWNAASHLPDQDEKKARILCIGGTWLKDRDDASAERFYKELVKRCNMTPLGREAATKHWFPKMELDGDELLKEVAPKLTR